MPKRVARIHKRIFERTPGSLLAWWQSLTPKEKKIARQRQQKSYYRSTKRGKEVKTASNKKYWQSVKGKVAIKNANEKYWQTEGGKASRKVGQKRHSKT